MIGADHVRYATCLSELSRMVSRLVNPRAKASRSIFVDPLG